MGKKEINKLFRELELNAYDVTYHKYYFKEANQIIREHFNQLKSENEELKKSLKEVLSQLEDRGGFDAIVLGIKQLLTNK